MVQGRCKGGSSSQSAALGTREAVERRSEGARRGEREDLQLESKKAEANALLERLVADSYFKSATYQRVGLGGEVEAIETKRDIISHASFALCRSLSS